MLELAAEDPALAERISPDLPDLVAEATFSARREQALTLADVLLRRTRLGLLDGAGAQRAGVRGRGAGGAGAGAGSSAGTTQRYQQELDGWREVARAEGLAGTRRHAGHERGSRRRAQADRAAGGRARGGGVSIAPLVLRGRVLELDEPLLMGIVNATPDSFSDVQRPDERGRAGRAGRAAGRRGRRR